MKEIKCIICNKPATLVLEDFHGYTKGEKFEIYHCSFCNTSFAWPHAVDNRVYEIIYSQPDIVPGYNRYALYAKEIVNKKNALDYLADKEAMYYAVKELLNQTDKNIKILEVGSGLGYLTYAISQYGYDITGLDISNDAVKMAENQFGKHFVCGDVYQYALNNPGKFELVILTEVIEHLPDPVNFCNSLVEILKAGGRLIITTPNKSAHPPQEYWNTELPPVHLTWFSEESFKVIAKEKGLDISFFDFTRFNKKHLDIPRFRYYEWYMKSRQVVPTLSRDGKILQPKALIADTLMKKLKINIKKYIKKVMEPMVIAAFTHKKDPARNTILCVILQKK